MSSFEVLQVLNLQVLVLGHFSHPKVLDIIKTNESLNGLLLIRTKQFILITEKRFEN